MKIVVNSFAYGRSLGLVEMIDSAASDKHQVEHHISLHTHQNLAVVGVCRALAGRPGVRIYDYGFNRGLARSINDVLINAWNSGADLVVNINDDVVLEPGALDVLAQAAVDHPESYAVTGLMEEREELKWSWYCIVGFTRVAWDVLGCFDQNYFPAYFEDNDYHYRSKLAGLEVAIADVKLGSHIGSATIWDNAALMEQNHQTFVQNREYYIRKWGGLPGAETQQQAFGQFGVRIDPADRDCPYGVEYQRTDQGIVKI